jgi:mannose-1-phosphate guanylyltransferase
MPQKPEETSMTQEAIILCGGYGQRLKPYTDVSKPLLELKPNLTLVNYQIHWLQKFGFQRIILAGRDQALTDLDVEYSTETEKLGTGGALKQAAQMCTEDYVYAMNVDDVLLGDYNPAQLERHADQGAVIVIAHPRLQFGQVQIRNNFITGFAQKPYLDFYVSAGHYTFQIGVIREHFPDTGDFENETSPHLASQRMLRPYIFTGVWLTINTYKDLLMVRRQLEKYLN